MSKADEVIEAMVEADADGAFDSLTADRVRRVLRAALEAAAELVDRQAGIGTPDDGVYGTRGDMVYQHLRRAAYGDSDE